MSSGLSKELTQRSCNSVAIIANTDLASSTSAKIPAAMGAAADVPPCLSVQEFLPTSVVCCDEQCVRYLTVQDVALGKSLTMLSPLPELYVTTILAEHASE